MWVKDLTKRITIPLGFYDLEGEGPLANAIFGLILILFTFFAPGGIVSLGRLVQSKLIQIIPLDPDGVPIERADDLDPGQESTKAQAAMKLAIIGAVLLPIGWLAMNINNLIVGVFAFGLRFQILILMPMALIVGLNELKAHKDGLRPDSVVGPANVARIVGAIGCAFIVLFGFFHFIDQYAKGFDLPIV